MIRLIGGDFKNHDIKTDALEGKKTRPSLAIVRKSLFDLLESFEGKRCLDLFAGSGVLGIEALSRGAEYVFFIDRDKSAASLIRRNLEEMKLSSKSEVHNTDYRMALKALSKRKEMFDAVFLDPPYRLTKAFDVINHLLDSKILASNGIGILLSSSKDNTSFENVNIVKDKLFSTTRITIFKGV